MKIAEILKMDSGIKGLRVSGVVGYIDVVKTHPAKGDKGEWTSQFIVIKDADASIGVSLNNNVMGKDYKGKEVELTLCTTREYEDKEGNTKMSLSSAGAFNVVGSAPVTMESPKASPEKPLSVAGPDWDILNMRKERNMCVAYAKDLAVAGKISIDEILNLAERFVRYIYKGIGDNTPQQEEIVKSEADDTQIPF